MLRKQVQRIAAAAALALLVLFVQIPELAAQPTSGFCQTPAGACHPFPGIFGSTCVPPNVVVSACPTPTPTPIATPIATPTRTPTPIPVSYTIIEFLRSRELGYSYVMAATELDGAVSFNGGICCPGIGDGIGECLATVYYGTSSSPQSPPIWREWWCSYRDTSELWETGTVQVAHSDRYRFVFAGEASRRPPVGALQNAASSSIVWGFGVQSLTEPFFSWKGNVGRLLYQDARKVWPLGILDLGGLRWLYVMTFDFATGQFGLERYAWPDAYHVALHATTTDLGRLSAPLSPIAIDADGSLVSTVDIEPPTSPPAAGATALATRVNVRPQWAPSSGSTSIKVVRSRDEGRTWSETGMVIAAPPGRRLWGCGWAHTTGGGAVVPWRLLCTISTGLGPEVGDWNLAEVRFAGAKVPSISWGTTPVFWKK